MSRNAGCCPLIESNFVSADVCCRLAQICGTELRVAEALWLAEHWQLKDRRPGETQRAGPNAGKIWRSQMAKKVKTKKRPKPPKASKPVKRGIPEPNIDAVSDYLSETS